MKKFTFNCETAKNALTEIYKSGIIDTAITIEKAENIISTILSKYWGYDFNPLEDSLCGDKEPLKWTDCYLHCKCFNLGYDKSIKNTVFLTVTIRNYGNKLLNKKSNIVIPKVYFSTVEGTIDLE